MGTEARSRIRAPTRCGRGRAGAAGRCRRPQRASAPELSREPPSPARVPRLPVECPLERLVGRAAAGGRPFDQCPADNEPRQPHRHAPRRLGADGGGERRHPVARRRRLVVDHVVDARRAALDEGRAHLGGVVDVDEAGHPFAGPDDRVLTPRHPTADVALEGVPSTRAVEGAVAEDHAVDAGAVDHCTLGLGDRLCRGTERCRPARPQRPVLALDQAAGRIVEEGDALPDVALGRGSMRRTQQVGGSFATNAVVVGVVLAELPGLQAALGQRGQLVDDNSRSRLGDRVDHPLLVEDVTDDRLGPEPAQRSGLAWRARHRRHVVATCDELREQRLANRTTRAGDEYA